MTEACPVPTPAQRQYGDIQSRAEQLLIRRIDAALSEAAEQARTEIAAAGLDMPSPTSDYLAATAHQSLFCRLCKADPKTFSGGDSRIALAIIRNSQNIAARYWGADVQQVARA